MATKDNFNKAVFDMFGVGNDPENPQSAQSAASVSSSAPAAPVHAPVVPYTPSGRGSITYIAPGSYMEGTLKVKGDVEVAGDFKGEMTASGNVVIHASIESNITAARLDLIACKLTGDIHSSGLVTVDEKSAVMGNIYATEINCAGRVKGDLEISGNTTFQQTSKVEGNITTGTMTMERGAIISGGLTMKGAAEVKPAKTEAPATAELPADSAADSDKVVHAVH
jgi:cytoskeletal protein CcmA (bactofilin family)